MVQPTKGFTIIEILVALLLLSIIILIVVGGLNGFFKLTRQATGQSNASNGSQTVMEEIKGQWQDSVSYGKACIKTAVAGQAPNGATILVTDEDYAGTSLGTAYTPRYSTNCSLSTTTTAPGALANAAMRRVSVTTSALGTATNTSTLVLEIVAP